MRQRKLKNENKIFKTQFLKKIVEVIHRNFLNLCVIKNFKRNYYSSFTQLVRLKKESFTMNKFIIILTIIDLILRIVEIYISRKK